MEEQLEYKNISILFVVLNGFLRLSAMVKEDIRDTNLSDDEKARVVKYIELMQNPDFNKKWNTKDKYLVYSVVSYAIHKAYKHRDLLLHTMGVVERMMKRELKQKLITKSEYMFYRKTSFVLRRMCNKLGERDQYNMDLSDWDGGAIRLTYAKS